MDLHAVHVRLVRAIDSGDRFNSALGVSEVAIALRRHRLDRGTYPDDLSALVPTYLPRLPIDPATGRPPAYVRQDAGLTLKAEPIAGDSASSRALAWMVLKRSGPKTAPFPDRHPRTKH